MEKEIVNTDYKLEGVVIGDKTLNLGENKDSFLIKKRDGERSMTLKFDNITSVYLK